jgi:hypothetical protein
MEIFNQMAHTQELYVNFSTVSTVPPAPKGEDASSIDWGNTGSGTISPGGRVWSDDPALSADATNDMISGLDATAPLVSLDPADFLHLNQPAAITGTPSSNTSPDGTTWMPISTQLVESTSTDSFLATGVASTQPSVSTFSADLNLQLGIENNLLTQNLSTGLMGAIG